MATAVVALANIIAELLPTAVSAYRQIQQNDTTGSLQPVETILAQADANWDQVAATAAEQLGQATPSNQTPPTPEPPAAA